MLQHASIPTLIMCLAQITEDDRWLEEPFRPKRDTNLFADESGGLPADVQQAVRASDGSSRPVDVLIHATGFEVGKFLLPMQVHGRKGLLLSEVWGEDDPRAYLGITAPDFPNFFCLFGPNTNLAHGGSIVFQAECQMRYVTSCLVQMIESGIDTIDVRREVHDGYIEQVDSEHNELVWAHPGMNNWYRNARGRVFAPMPWTPVRYWRMTHDADLMDYHITLS